MAIRSYKETLVSHRKLLITTESAIILASFFIFLFIVYGPNPIAGQRILPLILIITTPIIFLSSIASSGAWNLANIQSYRDSIPKILRALLNATLLVSSLAFLFHLHTSRLFVLGNLISDVAAVVISRVVFTFIYNYRVGRAKAKKVLIVGELATPDDLSFLSEKNMNLEIFKFRKQLNENGDSWLAELEAVVKENSIDAIVISNRALSDNQILLDLSHFYRFGVSEIYLGTKLSYLAGRLEQLGDPDLLFISDGFVRTNGAFLKRLFDILFSFTLLVLLSPLMLLAAVGILLTSRGGIFYISKRIGLDNAPLTFPKFRTMYKGADLYRSEIIGTPDQNISERYKSDPRVTPFGRFLRRWSIDELPQLFCVLIGTMSVVGPRPILTEELKLIPKQAHFRFYAKPGLTGLWQISGRKEVDWETRMAQDVQYIESWSLFRDLIYVAKTVKTILIGRGAY